MPLRTKIFLILSVGILVILGVTVGLLLVKRAQQKATDTPAGQTTATTPNPPPVSGTVPQNTSGLTVKPLTKTETQQTAVRQFASIFIERYYTYSTQSNFQNIRDVQTLVSPALWKHLQSKLSGAAGTNQSFLGVTTDAVGTVLSDWNDNQATVVVTTEQRIEKDGVFTNKNQKYSVTLVKPGSAWLVDGVVLAQ